MFDIVAGGKVQAHAMVSRSGLNPRTLTPPIDPDELAPDSPGTGARRRRRRLRGGAEGVRFVDRVSIEGWFGDSYADLIPDRTDTTVLIGEAGESVGAGQIAARLGLESTGVVLPIAQLADKVRDIAREPSPILVGRSNPFVTRLVTLGRSAFERFAARRRRRRIVRHAFDNTTATVVAGGDSIGTEAAANYLARRVPYVWDNVPGSLSFDQVSKELGRFLQGRSASGQASQAIGEIDSIVAGLKGKAIDSVDAKLYSNRRAAASMHLAGAAQGGARRRRRQGHEPGDDRSGDGLRREVRRAMGGRRFARACARRRAAESQGGHEGRARGARERVAGNARQARRRDSRAAETGGRADARVSVLSAYKQGFLWITERVIPELKGKGVKGLHIKIATYHPDLSKKYKFLHGAEPLAAGALPGRRNVQRELGIQKDAVTLELVDDPKDIYTPAGDRRRRQVHLPGVVQPEDRGARVPREVPGLVARSGDDRLAAARSTDKRCPTPASKPILSASGTTTSRSCCRRSTTT